jgi:hypothetical protein
MRVKSTTHCSGFGTRFATGPVPLPLATAVVGSRGRERLTCHDCRADGTKRRLERRQTTTRARMTPRALATSPTTTRRPLPRRASSVRPATVAAKPSAPPGPTSPSATGLPAWRSARSRGGLHVHLFRYPAGMYTIMPSEATSAEAEMYIHKYTSVRRRGLWPDACTEV